MSRLLLRTSSAIRVKLGIGANGSNPLQWIANGLCRLLLIFMFRGTGIPYAGGASLVASVLISGLVFMFIFRSMTQPPSTGTPGMPALTSIRIPSKFLAVSVKFLQCVYLWMLIVTFTWSWSRIIELALLFGLRRSIDLGYGLMHELCQLWVSLPCLGVPFYQLCPPRGW